MYNITLICTRHKELGNCNSNELLQIIESINPEVIFEEIPPTYFEKFYIDKKQNNLETDTINKYAVTHKVEHIPVDSDNLPSERFFEEFRYMLEQIENLPDINGLNYRKLIDKGKSFAGIYGFEYLNSIYHEHLNSEIYNAIEKGLAEINDDKLIKTYELWKDIHDKRENEMLQNIYEYCKNHYFEKGIFTVGSAHRKSLIQKIQERELAGKIKLNWLLYNN